MCSSSSWPWIPLLAGVAAGFFAAQAFSFRRKAHALLRECADLREQLRAQLRSSP
jgi:hypothetical protein